MTPLEDFKLRLAALRARVNDNRVKAIDLGCDPALCVAHTEAWDELIMQVGVDYFAALKHLRPIRSIGSAGGLGAPILDLDVRRACVYQAATTRLLEEVAAVVGLVAESLAALVYTWMAAHNEGDPLAPWRMECEDRKVEVIDGEQARWAVRWEGRGPKLHDNLNVSEAQRRCRGDHTLRVELDEENTRRAHVREQVRKRIVHTLEADTILEPGDYFSHPSTAARSGTSGTIVKLSRVKFTYEASYMGKPIILTGRRTELLVPSVSRYVRAADVPELKAVL